MPKVVEKVLRAGEGRTLKKLQGLAAQVNLLEDDFKALTDAELREETDKFKQRLKDGETLDDLLPEAFAAVAHTLGLPARVAAGEHRQQAQHSEQVARTRASGPAPRPEGGCRHDVEDPSLSRRGPSYRGTHGTRRKSFNTAGMSVSNTQHQTSRLKAPGPKTVAEAEAEGVAP